MQFEHWPRARSRPLTSNVSQTNHFHATQTHTHSHTRSVCLCRFLLSHYLSQGDTKKSELIQRFHNGVCVCTLPSVICNELSQAMTSTLINFNQTNLLKSLAHTIHVMWSFPFLFIFYGAFEIANVWVDLLCVCVWMCCAYIIISVRVLKVLVSYRFM